MYTQRGGATNYLCLPNDPEWGNYTIRGNYTRKRNDISGCEYEKEDKAMFPFSSENSNVFDDEDAVCAVCRTRMRSTVVMSPGRMTCDSSWTLEYMGFLVSDFLKDQRSKFVCLDLAPETRGPVNANLDGAGFFMVLPNCNGTVHGPTLDCSIYHPNKEITCSVCSK